MLQYNKAKQLFYCSIYLCHCTWSPILSRWSIAWMIQRQARLLQLNPSITSEPISLPHTAWLSLSLYLSMSLCMCAYVVLLIQQMVIRWPCHTSDVTMTTVTMTVIESQRVDARLLMIVYRNNKVKVDMNFFHDTLFRGRSALRQGQLPQTSTLSAKCDMEHCLANSKHHHIGAKKERSVAFKIRQYALPQTCWGTQNAPRSIVSSTKDTPPFGALHSAPRFGGIVPNCFPYFV